MIVPSVSAWSKDASAALGLGGTHGEATLSNFSASGKTTRGRLSKSVQLPGSATGIFDMVLCDTNIFISAFMAEPTP